MTGATLLRPTQIFSAQAATPRPQTSQLLELRGLTKRFGNYVALDNLTLNVPRGSRTGIIGRSGAGKSTLVRILSGLETPDAGELYLSGENQLTLSASQRRQRQTRTGLVFQHFNLLHQRTALHNVALPLEFAGVAKAKREKLALEQLELVGLADFAGRFPAQLSGGQKQRVGIARALVTSPDLLLADEATSALDPETSASILDLLTRVQKERDLTLLIVTHQMEVVRSSTTHVAVLSEGKLVESGETGQVLANPKHAATRALLGAHRPNVNLEGNEALHQFIVTELDAQALAYVAQLGGRLIEAQPTIIGEREQVLVWLALPAHVDATDLQRRLGQVA